MGAFQDISGQRFGRLTVVSRAENVGKVVRWACRCDCGRVVVIRRQSIGARTWSCGCLNSEQRVTALKAHAAKRVAGRQERTLESLLAGAKRVGKCLIWQGAVNSKGRYGYGVATFRDGSVQYVHRAVYELANGRKLGPGIEACHHCDTPLCIEPSHLFDGTHTDNMRDAGAKGRLSHPSVRRLWTHCKHGHAFSPDNTIYIQGGRRCRECKHRRDREYAERKRTA